ncbi:MAG: hypothetical protein G01um101429_884 [Parcubacteria group bacterium Gr01-1014_29]|nr:MAG: hypothetical protein G01um101429_884 [Parcubacteria group bacterium Gr01-1014_29]
MILNLLAEGYTADEIRKEYPDITPQDVIAVLRFAARMTRFDETQKDLIPSSPS